jgi:hypothetical protein
MRDVLDFRPSRAFTYLGEFDVRAELPQNASAITINNIQYYLPRIDILVANATDSRGDIGFGELQVIQGESNVIPRERDSYRFNGTVQVPIESIHIWYCRPY